MTDAIALRRDPRASFETGAPGRASGRVSAIILQHRQKLPSQRPEIGARTGEMSFRSRRTEVHVSEQKVAAAIVPLVTAKPVKIVAAAAGVTERAVMKWRNAEGLPGLLAILKLAAGDDEVWRAIERLAGRSREITNQKIAETDLEIARLQAKREELLHEASYRGADGVRLSVAVDQGQQLRRAPDQMVELVDQMGRKV